MANKIKASDYIVQELFNQGVDTVFGYIGGMVTHLADSIDKHPKMKFIQVYHEQTAAFAAAGYARHKKRIGVAIATSGPGATNLITGIADAFFDSVPAIFITGQVNVYEYKYNTPIRQCGFQETNIVEMVRPITKYAKMIDNVKDLPEELAKAFQIASSGRKGPVVLDIPMNIQREVIDIDDVKTIFNKQVTSKYDKNLVKIIVTKINNSANPLILVGGGVAIANAINEFEKFIMTGKLPFISSLLGKSVCDETLENYMGTIGSYGNRCANMSVANADLLLILGARLDVRQTGGIIDSFAPNAEIFHVDIDANELEHSRIKNKTNVLYDIKEFLQEINKFSIEKVKSNWSQYIFALKEKYNQDREIIRTQTKSAPYQLFDFLNKKTSINDIFCVDVGQNQMWAMQTIKLGKEQCFYTSGGLGAMGSALPISLGVAFANENLGASVYSINGDGGAHMALQSLMLIKQYELPIKVIIINNKSLGMITQFQELYFESNMVGTTRDGGYHVPDFEYIAKAYGLDYFKIDMQNDRVLDTLLLSKFCNAKNGLLEYLVDENCRVYPKLEYNQAMYNPSPALNQDELAANMLLKIDK